MREYYLRNREKFSEQARRWRLENPERFRERYERWVSENPERSRSIKRRWAKAHPEAAVLAQQRRRARLAALEVNDLTAEQWEAIKAAASGRCTYCGKKRKLTMDHVVPISRGGGHTASNIVAACRSCNSSKHAGPVIPYQLPLLQ